MERLVNECEEKHKCIVSSIHGSSHLGVNRTLDIMNKYYWPGLNDDVKQYVSWN